MCESCEEGERLRVLRLAQASPCPRGERKSEFKSEGEIVNSYRKTRTEIMRQVVVWDILITL